jgi:hypothetical protein
MKIFRISSPMPVDAVPMSYGDSVVDRNLTYEDIQELGQYDLFDHLGGGQWGAAFSTRDEKVAKITSDMTEVAFAQDLQNSPWAKYAPFAKIYDVKKIKDNLYLILKEKVRNLTKSEKFLFYVFLDELSVLDEDEYPEEYKNNIIIEKIRDYVSDVANYPYVDVYNEENVGWDSDENIVCFDAQKNDF